MKRIAVLMTVHNRKDTTLRCLQSLYSQQYDTAQYSVAVFLTNDGCTDGTEDAVHVQYPDVHIVQGDGSLYWNRGMYEAWCVAEQQDFDFYLWLNDDTLLYDTALSSLLLASGEKNDAAIVVGSLCENGNPTSVTYGGRSAEGTLIQDVSMEQTCELMNGNFVLIPRRVYQILGKNNPEYHHALGDYDYAKRAGLQSIQIIIPKDVLGECNYRIQRWKDASFPLCTRFIDYWKVTGANPFDVFRYNNRYKGFARACIFLFSSFIRMLFPRLCNICNL